MFVLTVLITLLTLSWPAGHICPTYKESFQVRWDTSIPLFLHAAIYLEVSLFRWTSQNAFPRVQLIPCAMLHSSIAHSIICTLLFRGKMHSDWFNGIEILQSRWQHGEKVGYCYPSGLEKTLCKWDTRMCPTGHERVNKIPDKSYFIIFYCHLPWSSHQIKVTCLYWMQKSPVRL